MTTHLLSVVPNNFSLVGTRNYDLKHILDDQTGQRSFYQITIFDKSDWDSINNILPSLLIKALKK